MNTHSHTRLHRIALLTLALISGPALAQHDGHHSPAPTPPVLAAASGGPSPETAMAGAPATGELPWTDAEVRRVDARAGKVTLKHGDIANLGMPPMTMVFQAQDTAALAAFKVGDRVRFTADQLKGVYTVVRIEPLP